MHNTTAFPPPLSLSLPLHLICLLALPLSLHFLAIWRTRWRCKCQPRPQPRLEFPLPNENFHLQVVSVLSLLSFFSFYLSLYIFFVCCHLLCVAFICCSDFSGAYHQSGKSSGKLAACCTQLFACHLMHFLFMSATSLIRFSPAVFPDKPSSFLFFSYSNFLL